MYCLHCLHTMSAQHRLTGLGRLRGYRTCPVGSTESTSQCAALMTRAHQLTASRWHVLKTGRRGGLGRAKSAWGPNLHWGQTASREPATVAQARLGGGKKSLQRRGRKKKDKFSLVCSWPIAHQDIAISAGHELGAEECWNRICNPSSKCPVLINPGA